MPSCRVLARKRRLHESCRLLTETHLGASASIRDCRSLARSASRRADHSLRLPAMGCCATSNAGLHAARSCEHCTRLFGRSGFSWRFSAPCAWRSRLRRGTAGFANDVACRRPDGTCHHTRSLHRLNVMSPSAIARPRRSHRALNPNRSLLAALEMSSLFADCPDAVATTMAMPRLQSFDLTRDSGNLPRFPRLGSRARASGMAELCARGCRRRIRRSLSCPGVRGSTISCAHRAQSSAASFSTTTTLDLPVRSPRHPPRLRVPAAICCRPGTRSSGSSIGVILACPQSIHRKQLFLGVS